MFPILAMDTLVTALLRLNAGPGVEEEQVVDQRAGVLVLQIDGYERKVGLGCTRHLLALAGLQVTHWTWKVA